MIRLCGTFITRILKSTAIVLPAHSEILSDVFEMETPVNADFLKIEGAVTFPKVSLSSITLNNCYKLRNSNYIGQIYLILFENIFSIMEYIQDDLKLTVNIGMSTKSMNYIYFALHITVIGI